WFVCYQLQRYVSVFTDSDKEKEPVNVICNGDRSFAKAFQWAEPYEALFFPMHYHRLPISTCSVILLFTSLILAAFDLFIEFTLLTFERKPNCAALACFLKRNHSLAAYYWATNILVRRARCLSAVQVLRDLSLIQIFNLIAAFLTALFIAKLRRSQRRISRIRGACQRELNNFRQANRICAGILLTSLAFVTCPCVTVNIVNIFGGTIFTDIGPFFIAFLLCNGTFTNIVHLMLNRSMREQAKTFFKGGRVAATESVAPKELNTVTGSRAVVLHIS
ncbi:hypothetical protein COOONC_01132, partial [Cooperia oncophora]